MPGQVNRIVQDAQHFDDRRLIGSQNPKDDEVSAFAPTARRVQ
jgi:hypothetical protein